MKTLTEKQKRLLAYVAKFREENGMSPTVYEIAADFGITAPTVFSHVRALQKKGYIERTSKARSIRLLHEEKAGKDVKSSVKSPKIPKKKTVAEETEVAASSLFIPVLAEAPKEGKGILQAPMACQLECPPSQLPADVAVESLFAVQVKDDYLKFRGVLSGDIVIASNARVPVDGDLVVAARESDFFVRNLAIDQEDGIVCLVPQDSWSSTVETNALDKLGILGVVISLQRSY